MGRRILNEALRAIVNAERRGKATVELKPISTVMSSFLNIMKNRGKTPILGFFFITAQTLRFCFIASVLSYIISGIWILHDFGLEKVMNSIGFRSNLVFYLCVGVCCVVLVLISFSFGGTTWRSVGSSNLL